MRSGVPEVALGDVGRDDADVLVGVRVFGQELAARVGALFPVETGDLGRWQRVAPEGFDLGPEDAVLARAPRHGVGGEDLLRERRPAAHHTHHEHREPLAGGAHARHPRPALEHGQLLGVLREGQELLQRLHLLPGSSWSGHLQVARKPGPFGVFVKCWIHPYEIFHQKVKTGF